MSARSGPAAPDQPSTPRQSGQQVEPSPEQQGETKKPVELGGPKGPEPTRYGDWERNGRCSDF